MQIPAAAAPWHTLETAAVAEQLGRDAATGLSPQTVLLRTAQHGPNALPEPKKRTLVPVFLRQFKSPLIYILFVAAALAAHRFSWRPLARAETGSRPA